MFSIRGLAFEQYVHKILGDGYSVSSEESGIPPLENNIKYESVEIENSPDYIIATFSGDNRFESSLLLQDSFYEYIEYLTCLGFRFDSVSDVHYQENTVSLFFYFEFHTEEICDIKLLESIKVSTTNNQGMDWYPTPKPTDCSQSIWDIPLADKFRIDNFYWMPDCPAFGVGNSVLCATSFGGVDGKDWNLQGKWLPTCKIFSA